MIYLLNPDVLLKKYKGTLVYTKPDGSPGTVDGVPVIVDVSANGLATLGQTDPEGLNLLLTIGDTPIQDGDKSNFKVTADADLGDGVKELPYDIEIIWTRQVTGVGLAFVEVTE